MKSDPWVYKTEDGEDEYHFRFEERVDGEWRAYILKQPPYGSCPQDLSSTYRQYDHKGKYIDWSYTFESLEEAKQIAALWVEYTQECINKGGAGKTACRDKSQHSLRESHSYSSSQDGDSESFLSY